MWIYFINYFRVLKTIIFLKLRLRKKENKSKETIDLFNSSFNRDKLNYYWKPNLPWGYGFGGEDNRYFLGEYAVINGENKLDLRISYNKDKNEFKVGCLHNSGLCAFRYGKYEMKVKLCDLKEKWTAFWASHYDWKPNGYSRSFIIPEYDFIEMMNNKVVGSVHFGFSDDPLVYRLFMLCTSFKQPIDLSKDYHIFGFERTDKHLKWYIDGYCYAKIKYKHCLSDKYTFLYINESVNVNYVPENSFEKKTIVDWIRFTPYGENEFIHKAEKPELFNSTIYIKSK